MSRSPTRYRFEEALVEPLLPLPERTSTEQRAEVTQVASFVRGQLEALPRNLCLLMRTGLWGFRLVTRLRFLTDYGALPLPTRRRWVQQWAYGSVGPARKLFRAIRSNTLVAYYELPEVRSSITIDADDEDQAPGRR